MMTTTTAFYMRHKALLVPALILLTSVVISAYLVHAKIAEAGLTYSWVVTNDCADGWCFGPWSSGNCSMGCNAGTVGTHCQNITCSARPGCESVITNTDCTVTGCTPDSSCAASTCSGSFCSDGCGGLAAGTMSCPVSCTMTNACGASNTGTLIGSSCSVSAPPTVDACPTDPGLQCSSSECSVPTPSCSNGSSGPYPSCPLPTTTCSVQTCPSASNICQGDSCTIVAGDCSTATVNGTKTTGSCAVPPPTGGGGGGGGGGSCTSPTVSITAAPTRVKSGQTTTLTVTGSGLTQACTVTGTGSGSSLHQTLTPSSCNLSPNPTTITTPPITTQSTFTVSCPDVTSSANISVIINLNPVFTPF